MGKVLFMILFSLVLSSCDNDASVKVKLDSVGKKFDSSAEKIWDSTKEKSREIKNKIVNKINKRNSD